MFKHTVTHDVFEIHKLNDEKGNGIELVPERGGIVSRFTIAGEDIFYLDQETLEDRSKNIRGGNPVLFPICGPLKDNRYLVGDQTYEMKQHGLARNMHWQVGAVEEAADKASITLKLANTEAGLKTYPFDFSVEFTYTISASGLLLEQTYYNSGQEPMPFYSGFHPYFSVADKQMLKFAIAATEYHDLLTGAIVPYDNQLKIPENQEYNVVFPRVDGGSVHFSDHKAGRCITIEYAKEFSYIVIWSLPGKPFVCVEPWMGNNNSMNSGENLKYLNPGEQMRTMVMYKVDQI